MEEALKFLIKRTYDKIILITILCDDLSGKRFAEIARNIRFDIMIFFSLIPIIKTIKNGIQFIKIIYQQMNTKYAKNILLIIMRPD